MSPTPHGNPPTRQDRLAAVEADLRACLADAETPAPDRVAELTGQVRAICRAQPPRAETDADECLAAARRIRELHERLVLRLTQQRAEAGRELAHVRKGKTTLRAYGQNA